MLLKGGGGGGRNQKWRVVTGKGDDKNFQYIYQFLLCALGNLWLYQSLLFCLNIFLLLFYVILCCFFMLLKNYFQSFLL